MQMVTMTMTGRPDARASRVDEKTFAGWVAAHQRVVWATAYSRLGDRARAEEIAQEAFLIAWRKLPSLESEPALPGYFCGIARNLARNQGRRHKAVTTDDAIERAVDSGPDPLDRMLAEERETLAWEAVGALPENLREVVVLHHGAGLALREVGAALAISEDAAKQRLRRARQKLSASVTRKMERGLRRAAPKAAFTAAVMAAVTSSRSAQAATASSTASWSASWLKWALAPLVALGGVWGVTHATAPPASPKTSPQAAAAPTASATTKARVASARTAPAPAWRAPRKRKTLAPRATTPDADPWHAPVSPALRAKLDKKIDIELSEASVTQVLKLLGEVADLNVFVTSDIEADVTFTLRASTAMEALDAALEQAAAVWREAPIVVVTAAPTAASPTLPGKPIDLTLDGAPLRQTLALFGDPIGIPVVVDDAVPPVAVTIAAQNEPAGAVLARLLQGAGLGHELVPAIEVRAVEDVDEDQLAR